MTAEYDFIVIGSGAGGGPLACRLARDPAGYRVALLEAGSDPTIKKSKDSSDVDENWNYSVPVLHGWASEDPQLSWKFFVDHFSNPARQKQDTKYFPKPGQPADSDPRFAGIFYPRAAAVGGCTAHNAQITIYPHPEDWEYLAKLTGDASWSPNNMRTYFERLEDCRYAPMDGNAGRHGFGNWLSTSLIDPRLLLDALKDPQVIAVAAGAVKTAIENALLRLGANPSEDQLKSMVQRLLVMRDAMRTSLEQIAGADATAAGILGGVNRFLTMTEDQATDLVRTLAPEISRIHELATGAGPFRRLLSNLDLDPVGTLIDGALRTAFGGVPLETILHLIIGHLDPNSWPVVQAGLEGVFAIPLATDGHRRSGPRDFIQATLDNCPYRLELMQNVLVTKIEFDGTRATGVQFIRQENGYFAAPNNKDRSLPQPSPLPATETLRVRPGGEIILCGGAFNTPQLLMLSGVGPMSEVQGKGIAPVGNRNWEGVGRNLQDRYEITVVAEMQNNFKILEKPKFKPVEGSGNDDPGFVEWRDQKKGVYTSNGALLSYIMRSSQAEHIVPPAEGTSTLPPPDLFLFGLLGYFKGYEPGYAAAIEKDRNQLTWAILKGHTRNSSGRVTLRSTDPRNTPFVNFNSFDDDHAAAMSNARKDVDALVEGVATVKQMLDRTGPAVKRITWPPVPIDNLQNEQQRAALRDFIVREAWGHHACGTCQIGAADDPQAVLDGNFRVHGLQGLRVVDASIFPKIPGFFIVTSVYMISEKAAEVILQDAARRG
jgi:choline dehydrogenase-like flavoprotein